MHHPTEGPTSRDAVARRRRMHRRHATRRLSRVALAVIGVFGAAALLEPIPATPPAGAVLSRAVSFDRASRPDLDGADGPVHRASLQRWHRIYRLSAQFRVKPELARIIHDVATREGLDPELGFRLVRAESRFNPRAVSPAGAVGLTQLMPSTAKLLEPTVTRDQLMDPEVNLRIGFRHLRRILREHDGDLRVALLEYNRGANAVHQDLARGTNPTNGYEFRVLGTYRGRGILN